MADVIRDAILTKLAAIPDIGQVHSYQRYSARAKDLADLYAYNGQLRGWFVRRSSVVDKKGVRGCNIEKTTWMLRGYLAIDDAAATELAFDDLLDAIRLAFKDEWTGALKLGIILPGIKEQAGIAVEETGPVLFSGVLCHSARCSLIVTRVVTYAVGG